MRLRVLPALLATVVVLERVVAQTSTQTDQVRLLSQKYAITNWDAYAAANNISGWVDDNSIPVCLWTGVTCNPEGRIQTLSLQCPNCALKATGAVASNLSAIIPMLTVNLQQQNLSGTLPSVYGGNGSFPNLINLLLNQNKLTGSVPLAWGAPGSFPNLALLTLFGNNLTGPLPEPQSWPQLNVFRAQNNRLSGTLPGSWAQSMPKLQILSLQSNRLNGSLPPEWALPGAFQNLEEIYLQDNQLEGPLPRGSPQLKISYPRLRIMDLSYNGFRGELPAERGSLGIAPSLELMYLRSLGLNGSLPAAWGNGLPRLRQLWLDGNNLSGTIPAEWANFPNLEQVYVRPGNEALCGPLPPGIKFKARLCSAEGNSECNQTAVLDGPTCPAWVPPPPPAPISSGGTSTGAIVGGVVGGVVGGALLVTAVVLGVRWSRRRKQRMSPFISESDAAASPPQKDDMSKYIKVLESVDGGFPEEEPQASGWGSRLASTVSSFFRSPSDSQPPSGALKAPAAPGAVDPVAAANAAALLAASGKVPSQDALGAMLYHNGSLLSSGDVEAAAGGPAGPAASPFAYNYGGTLTPGGAATPSGGLTPARLSGDVRRLTPPPPPTMDADVQQLSDWEIQPEEIRYMKRSDGTDWELGCGGFGRVFKALRNGAQPVAVKVLTSGPETRYMALNEFRREVAILKACRDPNIVAFLGACLRDDCAMLVTEYCEGGNLARNLLAHKVSWYKRGRKIAIDIAKGLVFLHSRRIVHLDLKSPNILLSRDGTAKIADVGLAKIIAKEYSAVTGAVGTLAWSSPEMLLGARCTEKSDIYSFGVVLWEIATGQTPIRGQLRDVKVPEECPEELRKLMLDCLEQSAKRRPTAQQLIERLRKIPVSPLENAAPPPVRADAAADSAAARQGRGAASTGGSGAATPTASSAFSAAATGGGAGSPPVSAFAAAAAAPSITPRTGSDASEPGRQGSLGMPWAAPQQGPAAGSGGAAAEPPPPPSFLGTTIAPAGSLPTPFGNLARQPSSAAVQLPAWTSSDELLGSATEGGTDAVASRSLSLSRDPSLAVPGLNISRTPSLHLPRAGSSLPPRPAPPAGAQPSPGQAAARARGAA